MSVPTQSGTPYPSIGRIDFGWIGQAWALFSAQTGVWVGAMVLYCLVDLLVWVVLAFPTGVFSTMQQAIAAAISHVPPRANANPYQQFAQNQVLAILLTGINAIFGGGFYRMALRQRRGEPIAATDFFSAFPQALPLFAIGILSPALLGLLQGLTLWALHRTMSATLSVSVIGMAALVPAAVLPALFMFAPLVVVETGANAAGGILGGIHLLRGRWLMGILFYVVVYLLSQAGAFVCGIGGLISVPLFYLSIATGYLALTQPFVSAPPEFDPAPPGVWPPPPTIPSSIPSSISSQTIPPGERE